MKKFENNYWLFRKRCYNTTCSAGVAHPVERHLAKVEVASSSLVTRSIKKKPRLLSWFSFLYVQKTRLEEWIPTVRWTVDRRERAPAIPLFSSIPGRKCKSTPVPCSIRKAKVWYKSIEPFFFAYREFFPFCSEHQHLVGVFNRTFARLFFFIYNNYGTKCLSTER